MLTKGGNRLPALREDQPAPGAWGSALGSERATLTDRVPIVCQVLQDLSGPCLSLEPCFVPFYPVPASQSIWVCFSSSNGPLFLVQTFVSPLVSA